jgi:uncharacterized protein YdeI (YjbR/CyaY-like superfamily)
MQKQVVADEKLHSLPADMRKALASSRLAKATWEDITPLARNEWICWVISVKKQETRDDHVRRLVEDLAKGKRRPCCFAGCFHRAGRVMPEYLKRQYA